MNACKGTNFRDYHVPAEDAAAIAGRDLSINMTRWCSDVSHMGYAKLAQDTGDPAVIDTVAVLLVALAAAKLAVEKCVRVRP